MKNFFLLFVLCVSAKLYAQNCTLTASAPVDTINCGQSVFLTVYGQGLGNLLMAENFDNGAYGPGWSSTTQAMWNNPCSQPGVDSTTHVWMGNSSPVPRILNTAMFNLGSCAQTGVTFCFDMLFATQGNSAPCEGPDEPQEGVYLQYKTATDTGWVTIHFFDPNGGNDPLLINWRNWCFNVPTPALTANTQFRFYQDNDSGADYDHWGIDNVAIYCNDANFAITWQHDGYNAGAAGGLNPTPVTPHTTTSYPVVMTSGAQTCYDTVTIAVRQPVLLIDAGTDTTICVANCLQLNAATKVIASPARTLLFAQPDTSSLVFLSLFPGMQDPSVPSINVSGLHIDTIQPGDINSVCITGLGGNVNTTSLQLICPGGDTVILVPAGVTTASTGSPIPPPSYLNTCFVTGGNSISSGMPSYTGNWAPAQPFSDFTGCPANGAWQLKVASTTAPAIVTLYGWSISFNDPEISYTGNFNWQPVANMVDSNTLTPTVCPDVSGAYVLTLADTAGCASATDTIYVMVDSCLADLPAPFTGNGSAWYISPLVTGKTDNCGPIEATTNTTGPIGCSSLPGVGCLYVQNDTVFRVCGTSHLFLYDYNAQAGDVWQVYDAPDTAVSFPGTAVTIHVDSVDVIVIHGQTLRRIKTSITNAALVNAGYVFGDVIEGIGSSYYFLPQHPQSPGDSIPFVSCFYSSLTGAVHFDEAGYTPVDSCVCQIVLGNGGLPADAGGMLTFSKYQRSITYTAALATPATVMVYNAVGQKLIAEKATALTHSVSTASLAAGVYIAVVTVGNHSMLTQKFVVTE